MAFPISVNDQITDSVTQVNTKVIGDAPAVAMGNIFESTSQAMANAAHNATAIQQQNNTNMQVDASTGISTLYSIDAASEGIDTPGK